MKKFIKQKPQDEQSIDILKRVAKRVEEATVDIHSIKYDIKTMKFDMKGIESDTAITKVDVEKIKENIEALEITLSKRMTYVADLITIQLDGKIQKQEKRIQKLEQIQQLA